MRHPWPGNVRELAHVVERSVLMAGDDIIKADHLGLADGGAAATITLDEMSLDDLEKVFIEKAMRRYDGNVSHAAEALGLSRSALYRRLEKHGL
jgi:DNA-binding NtrC family response regulator